MLLLLAAVLQVGLTAVSLVGKLAYSYDLGAWGFLEGIMNARSHPNILFWNITRFNPFYCLLEVGCVLGVRKLIARTSVHVNLGSHAGAVLICPAKAAATAGHIPSTPTADCTSCTAHRHTACSAEHRSTVFVAMQVLMGAAAARLVMVEGVDDEGKPLDSKPAPAGSVLMPIVGLLGITAARAAGEWPR